MYLESRRAEVAERTLEAYGEHLRAFAEWCDENRVGDVAAVTPRTLHEYRVDADAAQTTLSVRFSVLRQLVRFCEGLGAVEEGAAERIVLPERDPVARDEMLEKLIEDSGSVVPETDEEVRELFAERTQA